jgi:hypothetical protein
LLSQDQKLRKQLSEEYYPEGPPSWANLQYWGQILILFPV